jgi:hypothetical protein
VEEFLQLVLELQVDPRVDIRRYVISFLEELTKKFPQCALSFLKGVVSFFFFSRSLNAADRPLCRDGYAEGDGRGYKSECREAGDQHRELDLLPRRSAVHVRLASIRSFACVRVFVCMRVRVHACVLLLK